MKAFLKIYLSIILILNTSLLKGQSPFKVGVLAGINKAQIDGDYQTGYDKLGYGFGLKGGVVFNRRWEITTQLLYNQKGTEPKNNTTANKKKANIALSYAEIPLLGIYNFKLSEQGFYRFSLMAGCSYGRLIKSSIAISKFAAVDTISNTQLALDNLNKSEVSILVGLNYYIKSNWGINISHSTSVNFLYEDKTPIDPKLPRKPDHYKAFRNYFVSAKLFYDFISPKAKRPKKSTNSRSNSKLK